MMSSSFPDQRPAVDPLGTSNFAGVENSIEQASLSLERTTPPDLAQARRFLHILAGDAPVTFQTFSDRKELMRSWTDKVTGQEKRFDPNAHVFHGSLDEHVATLSELNALGVGIFVMVNEGDGIVRSSARTCRTAANVIRVRAHVLDLDGAPLQPVLEAGVPPHLVVESSPGRWHVYWLVDDCPLDDFSRRQERLNAQFNADPSAKDLPRVLRVPGFFNHKSGEPVMSRLIAPNIEGLH